MINVKVDPDYVNSKSLEIVVIKLLFGTNSDCTIICS